jgi:Concanavalin A-like lectin/glucanases superfamily
MSTPQPSFIDKYVKAPFNSLKQSSSNALSSSTANININTNSSFTNSNSIVSKFVFLIIVLIIFVVALQLCSQFLVWFFAPSDSPILINGMIDAKQMMQIPQNPSVKGAIPILRSVNDTNGLEFTWSVWIYVDDITYNDDNYRHIFHKGNDGINVSGGPMTGMNTPNNGPGLYIAPKTNRLVVVMSTFENPSDEMTISDLPLNNWVNVIIRVSNQTQLDVYINGVLTKRRQLTSIPKQNYGDVYVSMNGGFSGFTSDLKYFNSSIGTYDIQSIVDSGPNTKMSGSSNVQNGDQHYLSSRWYYNQAH